MKNLVCGLKMPPKEERYELGLVVLFDSLGAKLDEAYCLLDSDDVTMLTDDNFGTVDLDKLAEMSQLKG